MGVVVTAALLAAALGLGLSAPAAAQSTDLGEPAEVELFEIEVDQEWTVDDLRPSTDVIAYQSNGTLWEATTSVTLPQGGVPVVNGFSARSDGQSYPVLWTVATPQGIAPNALPAGGEAGGKIYFDVTGAAPTAVAYSVNGQDVAVWGK